MARYAIAYAHPKQRQSPAVPLAVLSEDEGGVFIAPVGRDLDALAAELGGDVAQWRRYATAGRVDPRHPLQRARPSVPRTPRGYDGLECYLNIPLSESMSHGAVSFFGGVEERPGSAPEVAAAVARELGGRAEPGAI